MKRSAPFALVSWVRLLWSDPGTAARCLLALGVGDARRDPVAVVLVGPLLGLLGIRVGNGSGLVYEPALGHLCLVVLNLEGLEMAVNEINNS